MGADATLAGLLSWTLQQELLAAVQLAYLAGIVPSPGLKDAFLRFSQKELEHFSRVAGITHETGGPVRRDLAQLELEVDEIAALVFLESVEDTLIHCYEDMVALAGVPLKARIQAVLDEEREHKDEMAALLKAAKEDLRSTAR